MNILDFKLGLDLVFTYWFSRRSVFCQNSFPLQNQKLCTKSVLDLKPKTLVGEVAIEGLCVDTERHDFHNNLWSLGLKRGQKIDLLAWIEWLWIRLRYTLLPIFWFKTRTKTVNLCHISLALSKKSFSAWVDLSNRWLIVWVSTCCKLKPVWVSTVSYVHNMGGNTLVLLSRAFFW